MTNNNETFELKEDKLNKVSGGAPTNFTHLYSVNQKVIDTCDWILTITGLAGWNNACNCPSYICRIEVLSAGYSGSWNVGDTISRAENLLKPYNQ